VPPLHRAARGGRGAEGGRGGALGPRTCHWEEQAPSPVRSRPPCSRSLVAAGPDRAFRAASHLPGEPTRRSTARVGAVLRHGMRPVLCVGETEAERRQGLTFTVVEGQLRAGWAGLSPDDLARCVLAYEPVWAIGTGVNATRARPPRCTATFAASSPSRVQGAGAVDAHPLYGGSVQARQCPGPSPSRPDIARRARGRR